MWLFFMPFFIFLPVAVIAYTFYELHKMDIFHPSAILGYKRDYSRTRVTTVATSILSTFFARLIVIFLVM